METTLTAVEMTGTVDEHHQLQLDRTLPLSGPLRVRVIVLYPLAEDLDEAGWLRAASRNPTFQFLKEPREDIYSPTDGKLFNDQA
jgi:hypothetical protein